VQQLILHFFNITGGTDLSMFEVDEAARIITESCDPEANIIFGATINDNYTGEIKITVVATGFNEESNQRHFEAPKQSNQPFGKQRPVTTFGQQQVFQKPTTPDPANDLEVPAFLRNKLK
jgi:cell division protein FtsZ